MQDALYAAICSGKVHSAHDVSEGGLFVTLAESAMQGKTGFDICTDAHIRKDAFLFGEAQGRAVISISPSNKESIEKHFADMGVDCLHIGSVKGNSMVIDSEDFGSTADIKNLYHNALALRLGA
jgi:phosphoribosylformylglycinamidine synthase